MGERAAQHPPTANRPPHTVVPRPVQLPHPPLYLACTNPETVRRAAEYGVGPMVLGFGGPQVIASMRAAFDDARASRDPDACVSPGYVNDEFVALCPSVPDGRPRRGAAHRCACIAVLRRGDQPLGGPEWRCARARNRQGRQHRLHDRSTTPPPRPRLRRVRHLRRPLRRSTTSTTRSATPTPRSTTCIASTKRAATT